MLMLQTDQALAQHGRLWKVQARQLNFVLKSVLVRSGCYNKIPQTEQLVNNKNLFLTVLEAASPRSGCQHGQILVKVYSSMLQTADFLLCPHVVEGARELSGIPFIKALTLFTRAPPSRPDHFPKTFSPSTNTLRIRVSKYEFWGNTNIETTAKRILDIY